MSAWVGFAQGLDRSFFQQLPGTMSDHRKKKEADKTRAQNEAFTRFYAAANLENNEQAIAAMNAVLQNDPVARGIIEKELGLGGDTGRNLFGLQVFTGPGGEKRVAAKINNTNLGSNGPATQNASSSPKDMVLSTNLSAIRSYLSGIGGNYGLKTGEAKRYILGENQVLTDASGRRLAEGKPKEPKDAVSIIESEKFRKRVDSLYKEVASALGGLLTDANIPLWKGATYTAVRLLAEKHVNPYDALPIARALFENEGFAQNIEKMLQGPVGKQRVGAVLAQAIYKHLQGEKPQSQKVVPSPKGKSPVSPKKAKPPRPSASDYGIGAQRRGGAPGDFEFGRDLFGASP